MVITVHGSKVVRKLPYVGNVYAVIWLFEGKIYCKFLWSVVKGSYQCTEIKFLRECVLWELVIELIYKKERITNDIWYMSKFNFYIKIKDTTL